MRIVLFLFANLLLVGTAVAQPQVYGDLRVSIVNSMKPEMEKDLGIQMVDNASRFGVKGTTELSEGITGLYKMEFGLHPQDHGTITYVKSVDFTNSASATGTENLALKRRNFYGGIKSGIGEILFGTPYLSYQTMGQEVDPFEDTAAGEHNEGATFGLSMFTAEMWVDNELIAYTTPHFLDGALAINAAFIPDDSEDNKHDFSAGATYHKDGILASLQFINSDAEMDEDKAQMLRVSGKYTAMEGLDVGFSYENANLEAGDLKQNYIYVSGTYEFMEGCKAGLSVGNQSDDNDNNDNMFDGLGVNVGGWHNFGKTTTLYALFSMVNFKEDKDAAGMEDDNNIQKVALGVSHKF